MGATNFSRSACVRCGAAEGGAEELAGGAAVWVGVAVWVNAVLTAIPAMRTAQSEVFNAFINRSVSLHRSSPGALGGAENLPRLNLLHQRRIVLQKFLVPTRRCFLFICFVNGGGCPRPPGIIVFSCCDSL